MVVVCGEELLPLCHDVSQAVSKPLHGLFGHKEPAIVAWCKAGRINLSFIHQLDNRSVHQRGPEVFNQIRGQRGVSPFDLMHESEVRMETMAFDYTDV